MPLKKVDARVRTLIENSVTLKHRCMFVVVGDKGRDQVVFLHHMLSKASVKARPSVLWCYKKELGFSSHRKKRMRQLQKKLKSGSIDVSQDDPFELFIAATSIRYCYYSETHKILGNTYGMCVLQDFEAVTPNLLARTIETVEGGGVVVLLLRTMTSLKQLYTLAMDVHSRYRTEAHQELTARFNERFLLSLSDCHHCMVIDDQLNILPISSHMLSIKPTPLKHNVDDEHDELKSLQLSLSDTQPVGDLVKCCKTLDQAKALLKFVEAISEQTLRSTVTMTAARGRGKSAALGLGIAAAVAFGYSNIFVTSPSPENLKTLFEFVFRGFDAVHLEEHEHYDIIQSTNPEFNKAVVRVNVYSQHRQTIQYIQPGDAHKLEQAELVVIDEAAAIPLPLVKKLLAPCLVFMASTVNGYEGTGRSLSLKLIEQLRQQSAVGGVSGRLLKEVTLSLPIRYSQDDPIEKWLHQLLCLDVGSVVPRVSGGCPLPNECQLYLINRDTLFCYHRASEEFLHRLMSLYVASHYKNTPNDLQLLSDAPAHQLYVLLGPVSMETTTLPEILCVIQVCLEGGISRSSVMSSLSRGKRASGDLIPWTIAQQFTDEEFAGLSGARVVRIATHPDFQRMGYGSRALQLLTEYYQGKLTSLDEGIKPKRKGVEPVATVTENGEGLLKETISPRSHLPPLLSQLSEGQPEAIDYIGVSYGLTASLYKFWNRAEFLPVYLRQTPNELTGEHSCIMIRTVARGDSDSDHSWLTQFHSDFCCRFMSLLGYQFRCFSPSTALSLLHSKYSQQKKDFSHSEMMSTFSKFDLKRLELYSRNMADHHLITDLLPALGRLYFGGRSGLKLSAVQGAILLGMALQYKTVDMLQAELDLPSGQILGLFIRIIRKFVQLFNSLEEGVASSTLAPPTSDVHLQPLEQSIDQELEEAAVEFKETQEKKRVELDTMDLSMYAVSSVEDQWDSALASSVRSKEAPSIVSLARSKGNRTKQAPATSSLSRQTKTKKHHKPKRLKKS